MDLKNDMLPVYRSNFNKKPLGETVFVKTSE